MDFLSYVFRMSHQTSLRRAATIILTLSAISLASEQVLPTIENRKTESEGSGLWELRTKSIDLPLSPTFPPPSEIQWPPTPAENEEAATRAPAQDKAVVGPPAPPKASRVLIDAGHGGHDRGAHGLLGLTEKKLCLSIGELVLEEVNRLQRLKNFSIETKLSRTDDSYLSLRDRVRKANEWGADLFVSIHINSAEAPRPRGFEVYFLNPEATDANARALANLENQLSGNSGPVKADVMSILSDAQATHHIAQSSRFAEALFQAMSRKIRPNGLGVRQAPFTVLSGTSMPAILIEVGFISNPDEAKLLSQKGYLRRIANAISTGILEFAMTLKKA